MTGRILSLIVSPARAGKTVDTLLRRELGLSGTSVKRAKANDGGIALDGTPVRTDQRAAQGQTLTVFIGDGQTGAICPMDGELDIVCEDEDILIVNKAAGMASHPGPGHYDDTLGNFIAGYYKKRGICAGFHPVSRLDKGTSGLMVVAKHAHAQEKLKIQLHTGAFERWYLAICEGVPAQAKGVIDAPIGCMEGSAIKREVHPDGARARTEYEVVQECGNRALVRLKLDTGRTHQIRVHMAHLGYPLTGDFLYGTEDKTLIARTALHSAALTLLHPMTGLTVRYTAPLPNDMKRLLQNA